MCSDDRLVIVVGSRQLQRSTTAVLPSSLESVIQVLSWLGFWGRSEQRRRGSEPSSVDQCVRAQVDGRIPTILALATAWVRLLTPSFP